MREQCSIAFIAYCQFIMKFGFRKPELVKMASVFSDYLACGFHLFFKDFLPVTGSNFGVPFWYFGFTEYL